MIYVNFNLLSYSILSSKNPTSNGEKSRAFRLASSIMRNKSAVLSMVTLGFLFITFNIWNVFYLESKPDCHGASLNTTRPLIYAAFGRKVCYFYCIFLHIMFFVYWFFICTMFIKEGEEVLVVLSFCFFKKNSISFFE